jgi:hypothetical protein
VNEPKTLLLTETGVESLPDGSTAVNVGPIVRALGFLTDGRGEDRGTDEHGRPLPDLMSLAFDVVEAIILGGRKADYFRQVKRDLEAQTEVGFRSSLSLAKSARRVHAAAPATSLDHAADALSALLAELARLSLDTARAQELQQAIESFRAFGVDRWVSATAQLLLAANALGVARPASEAPATPPKRQRRKSESKRPRAKETAKPSPPRRASRPKPPARKPAPPPPRGRKKAKKRKA